MDKNTGLAAVTHILGWFTGIFAPLLIYLMVKDDQFVKEHAKEALNFQITVLIAFVVSAVLFLVLIGALLLVVVAIVDIALCITAAIKASQGEDFKYPVAIPFVKC